MADTPHLFLCGGAACPDRGFARGAAPRHLRMGTDGGDVRLEIRRLADRLQTPLDAVAADLVEVAAYAYVADQAVGRGGPGALEYGDAWRRDLRLVVPVRRPDLWDATRATLEDTLSFVGGDDYRFRFVAADEPADPRRYVTDALPPDDAPDAEEVVTFSGGLDSLAGAVEEIAVGHRPVALVSHVSEGRMAARQTDLLRLLRRGLRAGAPHPTHAAVGVNKGRGTPTRDTHQRVRSFLFLALAAVTARRLGLRRVRLYENGVTALNLPPTGDLVGSRASRTAHPRGLAGFGRLFATLFGTPFEVQNPFRWKTKSEVLRGLRAAGFAGLAAAAVSCAHTRGLGRGRTHCGACSQCVDRRLAAVDAGLTDAEDPESHYATDPVLAPRDGPARTLAERYVGAALDLLAVDNPVAFAERYPEVARAVVPAGPPADATVAEAFALYKRHAAGVHRAVTELTRRHAAALARQEVPAGSLLGIAIGRVPGAAPPAVAPAPGPVADPGEFAIRWGAQAVPLGNTTEYRLAAALLGRRDRYLSLDELRRQVWDDGEVQANCIQRTVSNLRRKLADGFDGRVRIDGRQRGHYRLYLA